MKRWILIALMLVFAINTQAGAATLGTTPGEFSEKLNAILDIFEADHFKFPPSAETEDGDVITIALRVPVTLTAKMASMAEDAQIEMLMVQSLDGDVGQVRKLSVQCFAAVAGLSDGEHARLVPLAAYATEQQLLETRPFASNGGIELNFYIQDGAIVALIEPAEAPST
jgi:hypothetical protein